MNPLERRYLSGITEEQGKLVGYAAVFDSQSEDLGGVVELIRPGAFTRTLSDGHDVKALIDHDASRLIGRTKNGTLRLEQDERGLRFEITPPDTTAVRDLLTQVRGGFLDGCSFAFRVSKDGQRFSYAGPIPRRELLDVELREISVGVAFPAYPDTSVALRAMRPPQDLRRFRLRLAGI